MDSEIKNQRERRTNLNFQFQREASPLAWHFVITGKAMGNESVGEAATHDQRNKRRGLMERSDRFHRGLTKLLPFRALELSGNRVFERVGF